MKSVLITGGAGFIGQSLAAALLKAGHHVRILDNFNPQIHANQTLNASLQSAVELINADIRDRPKLAEALKGINCVVHLAAETGTGQSMYNIEHYFDVNVSGTALLLDILENNGVGDALETLVVASSRAVYGEGSYECETHGLIHPPERLHADLAEQKFDPFCPADNSVLKVVPTSETAPFQPSSYYGLTKQIQEQAILLYCRTHGLNGFGLRYQNVYGPGQSLKNPYTGILAVFSNLVRQNENINVFEDGLETRDFVYIDDVVEATKSCVEYAGQFTGPINVGSGVATSVLEVAERIIQYFGGQSKINVSGSFRAGDIRHNVADIGIAKEMLKFYPAVSFEDGLTRFLDWCRCQEASDKSAYYESISELETHGLLTR